MRRSPANAHTDRGRCSEPCRCREHASNRILHGRDPGSISSPKTRYCASLLWHGLILPADDQTVCISSFHKYQGKTPRTAFGRLALPSVLHDWGLELRLQLAAGLQALLPHMGTADKAPQRLPCRHSRASDNPSLHRHWMQ